MSNNHIEQVLGKAAFNRLVAHVGGIEYWVPKAEDTERALELIDWIGREAAIALIAYAGGARVYVYADHQQVLRARYNEIMRLIENGMTPPEVALTYTFTGRYTERQIRKIIAAEAFTDGAEC
jgi:Mor family transcriptional regulator